MPAFPLLSRTLSAEMYNRLLTMLPPPADGSIEAQIGRDTFAIAGIDSLGPIRSAEEASLAITVVAADCHAHDAFRLASLSANDIKVVMRCRSQAAMMLRTRAKAVERLERLQRAYPVELEQNDSVQPPAEAVADPATVQAAPTPSQEERARELLAAKAKYAREIGHATHFISNITADTVSPATAPSDPDPIIDPAIIAARPEPMAWRAAA